MRIAVLCPGPSLRETFRPHQSGGYATLIGVNRVAKWFGLGYWVALDHDLFDHVRPIGAPTWVVCGYERSLAIAKHPALAELTWFKKQDVQFLARPPVCPVNWSTWSETTAIVLAAQLGATEIDTYGNDWTGTADCDGWEGAQNRKDERWQRTRTVFEGLVPILAERGVTLRRVRPARKLEQVSS